MKRIILLLATLATIYSVNAKTIHWITFIDTTDPDVGQFDVIGRDVLYNRYINLINAALGEKGYNYALHDYYGARTSPQNCKTVVENLKTEPDDLIMFYYIGHGARAHNDNTRWPQMALAQHYDDKLVPLVWVHSTLKNKPHRLLVTIGMCCNSESNISPKMAPIFAPNYGNTYMSDAATENIAKLFLGQKGDIILSSSSPKEPSRPIGLGADKGIDIFTLYMTMGLSCVMDGDISPNWDSLLSCVSNGVNEKIQEIYHKTQTPQWESNLTGAEVPDNSIAQTATTPTPTHEEVDRQSQTSAEENESTDNRDKIINWLNSSFNLLINQQIDDEKRMELGDIILSKISDTSIPVRTLGQDSDIVVGRQDLKDFVGRLSTSRVLKGIAVANMNSSGIYVREIYQK